MRQDQKGTAFRMATEADSRALAALHVESWRANYRGALSDAYLDGPVEAERRSVWKERFERPRAGQIVMLAERAGSLVGFICGFADHDRTWGTLIDNLHVAPSHKGRGLGRGLMRAIAQHLVQASPGRPIHLYVLEANHAARGFYDRLGGEPVEHGRKLEPDGSECSVIRYAWPSPARLLEVAAEARPSGLSGGRGAGVEQPDQSQGDQDRDDDAHQQGP